MLDIYNYSSLCRRLDLAEAADKFGRMWGIGSVVGLVRGSTALSVRVVAIAAIALISLHSFKSDRTKQQAMRYWKVVERHAALEGRHAWHELIPGMPKKHKNFDTHFRWGMGLVIVETSSLDSRQKGLFKSIATQAPGSSPFVEASRNYLPEVVRALLIAGIRPNHEESQAVLSCLLATGTDEGIRELGTLEYVQAIIDAHPDVICNIQSIALETQLRNWGLILDRETWNSEQIVARRFNNSCTQDNLAAILPLLEQELSTEGVEGHYPLMTILLNNASKDCILRVMRRLNGKKGEIAFLERVCENDQTTLLTLLLSRIEMNDLLTAKGCVESLLVFACQKNYAKVVAMLCAYDVPLDPESTGQEEKSYLWEACKHHSADVIRLLLKHSKSVENVWRVCGSDEEHPLFEMCRDVANKEFILLWIKIDPECVLMSHKEKSLLEILIMDAEVHSEQEVQEQVEIAKAFFDIYEALICRHDHILYQYVLGRSSLKMIELFLAHDSGDQLSKVVSRPNEILQTRYNFLGEQGVLDLMDVIAKQKPWLLANLVVHASPPVQKVVVDLAISFMRRFDVHMTAL